MTQTFGQEFEELLGSRSAGHRGQYGALPGLLIEVMVDGAVEDYVLSDP